MVHPENSPAHPTAAPSSQGQSAQITPESRRNFLLGIVSLSHVFNHMESGIFSVLYPVMMGEFGFGYFAIGILQMAHQITAMGCQAAYGLLGRFFPRAVLLGAGNLLLGLFVMATGWSQSFAQIAVLRGLAGLGSSVQHPVGSAILVSYFEKARGRVLTLHHSAGNLGSLLAPAVAAGLLVVAGWRTTLIVIAVPSILMGLCYFFLRDKVVAAGEAGSARQKVRAGLSDYRACLSNRTVMLVSLIQMVGATGRGTGINQAFLTAFFISALGVNVTVAAGLLMVYQLSGLVGPLALGWLSDRFNRTWVVQLTLLASTISTLWLLAHHGFTPWLILNLIVYGSVVQSRGTLAQSMVSEAVPMHQLDVAFSLYYFIGFISGPAWTFLMGWLIDTRGFAFAFQVISVSYLVGVLLVFLATRGSEGARF